MFSFDKIYCHSMEYFHRVKIFSFDKKYIFIPECHVVLVRPGRIGSIRAKNGSPAVARSVLLSHSVAAFSQLHSASRKWI